jgi:CheY-like chemotaxis protein
MGLAVVHGIVTACGGSILVESEPEKGTIVKVLFPLIEAGSPREDVISEVMPGGTETILYVDDEESIARVGRQILERLGYTVESKTCPIEALDLLRADPQRYDLVITDMAMPRMSGDRLVKEILTLKPDMPIILCTGFSEKVDQDSAAAIGARLYLEKPFDRSALASSIRRALEKKSS